MKISIPQPCTEDWAKMTPTEHGAFCKACSKEVVDFTGMSAFQIRDVLAEQQHKGAQTCGRIRLRQMQDFNAMDFEFSSARQEVQTAWILTLMAVFGLTLFSCQNTVSKEMVEQLKVQTEMLAAEEEGLSTLPEQSTSETDSLKPSTILFPEPYSWDTVISQPVYITRIIAGEFPEWITVSGSVTLGWMHPIGVDVTMGNVTMTERYEIPLPMPPRIEDDSAVLIAEGNSNPSRQAPEEVRVPINQPANTETAEFTAKLAPLPITAETCLVVEAFTDIDLRCEIFNSENISCFQSQVALKPAVYSLPIPFTDFSKGNYQIRLESALSRQGIYFKISREISEVQG